MTSEVRVVRRKLNDGKFLHQTTCADDLTQDFLVDILERFLTAHECLQLRHTCRKSWCGCPVLLRRIGIRLDDIPMAPSTPLPVWNLIIRYGEPFSTARVSPHFLKSLTWSAGRNKEAELRSFCASLPTLSPHCALTMVHIPEILSFGNTLLVCPWLRKLYLYYDLFPTFPNPITLVMESLPPALEVLHLCGNFCVRSLPDSLQELDVDLSTATHLRHAIFIPPRLTSLRVYARTQVNVVFVQIVLPEGGLSGNFYARFTGGQEKVYNQEYIFANWSSLTLLKRLVLPSNDKTGPLPASLTYLLLRDFMDDVRFLPSSLQSLKLLSRDPSLESVEHLTNLTTLDWNPPKGKTIRLPRGNIMRLRSGF